MIESGFITAIGVIWLLCRLPIKRVAGYPFIVDTVLSIGLAIIFIGTYAGMVTGLFAGALISLFLTLIRRTVGYEKLKWVRYNGEAFAKPRWRPFK